MPRFAEIQLPATFLRRSCEAQDFLPQLRHANLRWMKAFHTESTSDKDRSTLLYFNFARELHVPAKCTHRYHAPQDDEDVAWELSA